MALTNRSLTNLKQTTALKYKVTRLQKDLDEMRHTEVAKNRFLANITHELRTPLNTIIGFSQILSRDTDLTSQQTEYVSLIMQSGEHLLNLIEDILQFSKIESGNISLNHDEFDLYELLEGLDSIYYAQASEKGIEFDLQIADNTPRYLYGDKNKIRQILMNLLSNSMKFTETGKICLVINCLSKDEVSAVCTLEMRVSDTGIGIKEAEIARLFEPYQQTTSGEQSNTGSGLGLVITRELVHLMNGQINVQSEWQKGTTFCLTIQAETRDKNIAKHSNSGKAISISPRQTTKRILVVDDKPKNRSLLQDLLTSVGFEVATAENGHQALAKCEAWQPHLIFMDMRMPEMNGYETTQAIRKTPFGQSVIIIALTANTFKHEINAISQAECDDLIFKPFRAVELFRKLSEHLKIDFIYDEGEAVPEHSEPSTNSHNIDCLPDDLQTRLYRAATSYSFDQVQSVISDFPSEHQRLSNILQKKISEFDFVGILNFCNKKESSIS